MGVLEINNIRTGFQVLTQEKMVDREEVHGLILII